MVATLQPAASATSKLTRVTSTSSSNGIGSGPPAFTACTKAAAQAHDPRQPRMTVMTRGDYGEQRMIGIGLLDFLVVLIVHVESDHEIRIISMGKATSDETDLFYRNAGYF